MAVLAGIERNATVTVPKGAKATVLEVSRPALRLLRKLPKFGQTLDDTYRTHGFERVVEDISAATKKTLSKALIDQLRPHARYMVYGKHHVVSREDTPIDKLVLIKSGWVRRSKGVPFHATSPEVVMGMGQNIGVDFLGQGNCLGLEALKTDAKWQYTATLLAPTEVMEIPIASLEPSVRDELASTLATLSYVDE